MFIWHNISRSPVFISLIIYLSTSVGALQFATQNRSPIHTQPHHLRTLATPIHTHTIRTSAISSPLFNSNISAGGISNNNSNENSKSMIPYIALWARGLLLFGVGYGVGSICAPGWQRQTVVMNKIGFTRIALALFILRDVWRSTPHWVKPRITRHGRKVMNVLMLPFRREKQSIEDDSEDEDDDDLTNLSNFRDKVQNVMNVAKSKLDIKEDEQFNIEAAVLALLQMLWQVKAKSTRAISRDDIYRTSGTKDIPDDMLNGIDEYFELADLAYDEHKDGSLEKVLNTMGYNLIKHDKTAVPGYLGHYIALSTSKEKKIAVIGVKGTSNVEDFVTDVCATAVQYNLPNEGGSLTCHEGIYISSERLYKQILPTVRDLLIPSGYKIVIVGHRKVRVSIVLSCEFM